MLNKKGLSPLILEIIGGVIVVAIILVLFTGFASPFLEFLSDSKNIEAFNKFTNAMNRACREGSETVSYFTLGYKSTREIYAIGLISGETTAAIENMQQCDLTSTTTCTTAKSRDVIGKCWGGVYCWCLFKIKFNYTGSFKPYCANWNINGISVSNSNKTNINTDWDSKFKSDIVSSNISKVDVLICSDMYRDIGCNTTINKAQTLVFPRAGNDSGYLVWIQSRIIKQEPLFFGPSLVATDLVLDSISFDRSVLGTGFIDYMTFVSNPRLNIALKNSTNDIKIWETTCP